ncbi:23S rRNA pseudouridine(1911/1915/1917) synthase RluD [Acidihalobacter prosperus]|uniref:Pseudouridine synthase n=1 Tax=Acidihalobacter prosperus TaxID=160660 RepID=A0A1A6C3B0_9GAMM|nr:23S rRNA pseudouridine(1911/1915/1917) synthase RluD [Acidihalobacter prosperus]OBS09030.1 ribosomal large subunit pseudouridine synthase D [Acidihalobacter prosperus]
MPPNASLQFDIPPEFAGRRVDQALAQLMPDYSRTRIKDWIEAGRVTLDGRVPRPRDSVTGGEAVSVRPLVAVIHEDRAQAIALDIRHEDDSLLVLNKPAGLVVHPAAGNPEGTLLNALLHHAPDLATLPRAGIVHRLDKDTSGLMVVAKTPGAHQALVAALAAREVSREYLALVQGELIAGGTVEEPIARHPRDRKRMGVVPGGKPAISHYRVIERFVGHTLVRVALETGRTHQIRVHMSHIRHPIVGDPVYGGRLRLPPGSDEALTNTMRGFRRQALHATRLALAHPVSGEHLVWDAEPPDDMTTLLAALREHVRGRGD